MLNNFKKSRIADSGNAQNRALSWSDVPLFAPALAVLASATVAVSALALFTPVMRPAPVIVLALDDPAPVVSHPAAPTNDDAKRVFTLTLANTPPLSRIDGSLPSDTAQQFVQQKTARENINFKAFQHVFADQIIPVSLEMPQEPTQQPAPEPAAPAVFKPTAGAIEFLPAPTKPELFEQPHSTEAGGIPLPEPSGKPQVGEQMASVAALDAHFERIDYDLATVRGSKDHVPRLFLEKLPADIADVLSPETRKRIFIKSVLPVILRVNEDILVARQRLVKLRATLDGGMTLADEQRDWLYQMAERYETDPYDWDAFMARVDIVPPSLAIAQAAEESGWGTSRFAREGNALFGQYTYKASHGMLPEERANGRRHLIRAYSSLVEGVRSYMHNLNYHRAYGEFRAARKWLRSHAKPMDGHSLAGELIRYSERGADYVKTIRHIIRINKLSPLDDARLHDDRWTQDGPAGLGRRS